MNEKKPTRRFSPALETTKTILLSCLLISLVVLVAVYVGGMRAYEVAVASNGPGEDFERLWSVVSDSEAEGLDSSRLFPEFIGYKQSSSLTPIATVADHGGISELYELVKPCILELFGSNSICTALSSVEGNQRLANAKANEEFVYLRYHTPVLYQLIYAYAADSLTVSENDIATGNEGNIGAYISELIIIPDKDFAAHRFIAYAADSNGHYYEFRPGDHVVSSDFYISKLAGVAHSVNTLPFFFLDDSRLRCDEPIIDGEIEYTNITVTPAFYDSEEIRDGLLELFEYNPEKLDGYSDATSHVYVDSHSQLRIESGNISFITTDASSVDNSFRGIHIDSLLGYISSDTDGLIDKLTAVDNLIQKLGEISLDLIGNGGDLCLGDVYLDGSLLVIEYFLTYNGIRIEGEPLLRAVLTEDTVCEVHLRPCALTAGETTSLSTSPRYTLNNLDKMGVLRPDVSINSVRMRYTDGEAAWTVILEK